VNSDAAPLEGLGWAQLSRWARKGGLALLDQGLFSGANFLVNILLARWLAPEEYGAFAVALSIYYLLLNFHTAVLTEPMMVFGAGKYRGQFRKYLGMLLYGHGGLSALIALLLGAAALVMHRLGSEPMAQALAGLAVASPFLLLLWLTRRASYVPMRPQFAVVGSGGNFIFVLIGIFLLLWQGLLSAFTGLVILGVAAVGASVIALMPLRPQVAGFAGNPAAGMVRQEHLHYGRWALGTVFLMWLPGNIAYTVLPAWAGLEGSAAVRALMNLILPVLQGISALSLLIVPHFATLYAQGRLEKAKKSALLFLAVFIAASLAYSAIIVLFRHELIQFFYKGKYAAYTHLLPVASLLPLAAGINSVVGGALRAMEKPQRVFQSYVFTALVGTTIGLPLIAYLGVTGAVLSMLLTIFTTSTAMIVYLKREMGELSI